MSNAPIQVEIWSDVLCPWCYIGKRRLESAVAALPEGTDVDILWRSFQLDPSAPHRHDDPHPRTVFEYLGAKYGQGSPEQRLAQAREMAAQVAQVAAQDGLHYDQSSSVVANSLDAHRLLHAAHEHGGAELQSAVKERFFAGYFTERADIGDRETLERLAVDAGMAPELVRQVLDSDSYAREVAEDQATAAAIGARGVPFFVIERKYGISGAQPVEAFTQVLTKVAAERGNPA